MGKSVWAALAGFLTDFVLSLGTDVALHAAKVYPAWGQPMDDGLSALATAYRLVFGVASGWVTARLAPRRPLKHAMVLGVLGTAVGLAGAAATWNSNLGPRWYGLALAASAIPCSWVGWRLSKR